MKIFFNIIRTLIFTAIVLFLIPYMYVGLGWLAIKTMLAINYLHANFSFFVFWLILLVVVVGIFRFVWALFKIIASILMKIANKICPYEGYANWVVIITTVISLGFFLYGFWGTNGWPSFIDGVSGIIISFLAIGLLGAIFHGTRAAWYGNDPTIDYENI